MVFHYRRTHAHAYAHAPRTHRTIHGTMHLIREWLPTSFLKSSAVRQRHTRTTYHHCHGHTHRQAIASTTSLHVNRTRTRTAHHRIAQHTHITRIIINNIHLNRAGLLARLTCTHIVSTRTRTHTHTHTHTLSSSIAHFHRTGNTHTQCTRTSHTHNIIIHQ
jgi:hypothetical protein